MQFFYFQIYPEERHALRGVQSHLNNLIDKYLMDCLGNSTLVFPDDITYSLLDFLWPYEEDLEKENK